VACGFVNAYSPCDSGIVNEIWVVADSEINTETTSKRWRVDLEALEAPIDKKMVNKNGVGADTEIITETPTEGDAWIRKCSQPLLTKKKSSKQLPKVTCGFVSTHIPYSLRNSQRKLSRCRLRNHHRNTFQKWRVDSKSWQPLLTQKKSTKTESVPTGKSSPKHLSKVTYGFRRAYSP